MRLIIIAAIAALMVGLGAGYLMWGSRAQRAMDELDAMKTRQTQQADEMKKLRDELTVERDRRQRLEEVISQGRK
jgi:Flp pilus assembly protein TadB